MFDPMTQRDRSNLLASLDRVARAEAGFVGSEFLAPVLKGAGVGVRIAGVTCRLHVDPPHFQGWGVFRAVSFDTARFVAAPPLAQRRRYLALFPAVRLILALRDGPRRWSAVAASAGDARFAIRGVVPVRFVDEDALLFDTIVARFDGGQFWFDAVDGRADPAAAQYLRQSLADNLAPQHVDRPGLTAEHRAAYTVHVVDRLERELRDRQRADAARRLTAEGRLKAALAHAGARLRDYAEQSEVYRVTYDVDGQRHTSVVRKDNLAVVTAGICLSGLDEAFDLGSLVGVLREGAAEGRLVRML
jgi:hypothetical protein